MRRLANADEQRMLAAWSGWAVPQLFDEQRGEWAYERDTLREMLGADAYDTARRTTINTHYTDPGIAAAMWQAVREFGFTEGRVLKPGCGAGIFLGLAPEGTRLGRAWSWTPRPRRSRHPARDTSHGVRPRR